MYDNKYVNLLSPTWKENISKSKASVIEKVKNAIVNGQYDDVFTDSDGVQWIYRRDLVSNVQSMYSTSLSTTQRWVHHASHHLRKSKDGGLVIYSLRNDDEVIDAVMFTEVSLTSQIQTLAKILTDVTTYRDSVSQMDESFTDEPELWGEEQEIRSMMNIIKTSLWELSNSCDNLAQSLSENLNS